MFTRQLQIPKQSAFLFGPRGTGKSTWLRKNFKDVSTYDLLNTRESLRLSREPSLLYQELKQLKSRSWVVIDEVQKVPALLDEVHRLIEENHLLFMLSGSSARKLKRGAANLLAGRARTTHLFPLTSTEMNFVLDLAKVLRFGLLPIAVQEADPESYLRTYTETYLQEEIKAEALTRQVGNFARFLEIAARQNGQVTNVSGISRDAQVARQTVQEYFNILIDTLIGNWLQPWKLKRSTKQVLHPKFYFFDSGVVRALSGRLPFPPTQEETGFLLETFIFHELQAYLSYKNLHYPLNFWSSHDQVEVDFLCETRSGFIAIECKGARRWDRSFDKGLKRMMGELGKKVLPIGVYLGERPLSSDDIQILPLIDFLKNLWNEEIIF